MTINNEIKESYCSFEVSKLLKEKGLNIATIKYFDFDGNSYTSLKYSYQTIDSIAKPTHASAIEWIRINFGIWVYTINGNTYNDGSWYWEIQDLNKELRDSRSFTKSFNSPHEATEAALLYTLKNLIP